MANAVYINYSCSPSGTGKITGTVTSGITWSGSTSTSAGTYLPGGTVLQWTATPVSGYNVSFQAWYYTTSMPDDPVSYSGSFTSMTLGTNWKTLEIRAVYSSVGPSSYNVTFSSTAAQGSISPSGTISYNSGTSVQVTAQANAGYRFNVWTGDFLSGGTGLADNFKTATATFTVNKAGTVTANYWPAYRCDVISSDTSKGTVTKTYSNTQGPWGNIPLYDNNASITLTATASTNYEFVNWTDTNTGTVLSTSNPYTFSLTADKYITGNFRGATKTISTSVTPSSTGTTAVSGSTRYGETCTVTATPATGYHFVNWLEGGSPVFADNPWSFTVTGNRTLVANMSPNVYTISASVNPAGSGSVSGTGQKNYGSSCTVTATANTGYHFSNWTESGTQVSTSASYTFTVSGNRTLVANIPIYTYTISVSAGTGGTVTGGGTYNYGQSVTVYATPSSGYQFSNWTEDSTVVSTEATYSFTATANKTLTANFSVASSATDGLLVWLPLTDGIVNKGLSNTVMTNYSCTVDTSGKLGSCYAFTGSSSIRGTLSNFDKNCWSAACWVLATASSSSGHQYMVSLNTSTASDFTFTLCWYQNKFGVRTGDTTYSSDITGLTSVWTHVCATYENSTLKIYINGVLNKTVSSPKAPVAASGLFLGMRGGTAGYFTGKLNDVRIYNRAISQKEISEISKGLVLHYKLNRVNADGYTYDCSGNGYKGTNGGTLVVNSSTPRYASSIYFDGNTSVIENSMDISSLLNNQCTINFWINPDGESGARSVFFGDYQNSTANFNLEKTTANKLRFYWNGTTDINSTGTLPDSTWKMVTVVCDGLSSTKIYFNGVIDTTNSTAKTSYTFPSPWRIGRDSRTGATAYKGYMSDFRIYATALSESDIKELYNISMTIDNKGNILPRELSESYASSSVTKTGLLKTSNVVEGSTLASIKANGEVYCNNLEEY